MHRLLTAAVLLGACQLANADILVYSLDSPNDQVDEFRDLVAHFGPPLPIDGFKGKVVLADPLDACSPLQPPPVQAGFPEKWVALIRRYDCNFEDKIRAAQNANFSGVIVYNVNSTDLEPMSAKNPAGIHIYSVFVGEYSGRTIAENFLYSEGYYVIINDDFPFDINTHLLLPFAIVVGICFLIMVGFMVVKCIKDRRRSRRYRLPSSSLRKIPTSKFAKGDPYDTCAICLEDYVEGDKLRVLPCAHAYHTKCIDPWLTRNRRVCPVCKRKVFAHDEHFTDTDSDSDADDTAPLVRPSAQHRTQGGTFQTQAENPFVVANRAVAESSGTSSAASSAGNSVVVVPGRRTSVAGPSSSLAIDDVCLEVGSGHSINSCPEQYLVGHRPADESRAADEVAIDAGLTNPVVTNPVVTNPVVTNPVVTNPVVTVSSTSERPSRKQDLVV